MSDSESGISDIAVTDSKTPQAGKNPPIRRDLWSSRLAFILAATGSAVGLGNIWKFPYIAGEYGGGAFVLIYLACIATIGIPIMMAEIMLGRRGRNDPVSTMRQLARESGRSKYWRFLGWMGVIAGFLILSYYSVIAGWALAYVPRMALGLFQGADSEAVKQIFNSLIADPEALIAWHSLFLFMTMAVVARGVRGGLEKAVTYLMPLLFALLVVLILYAMKTGYFSQGLSFLLDPDFSKIGPKGVLSAMGHAFFTLSLGMGSIMIYGSYLPGHTSIAKATVAVAFMDTMVALMAGMVIFPIVLANSLSPAEGPSLIFQTLPLAFGQMDNGVLFGTIFFVLIVFAAWTSSISLVEPVITWAMKTFSVSRITAVFYCGALVWCLGLLSVFSFNLASDVTISSSIDTRYGEFVILKDATMFDFLDYLTSNILLPLGGLMIALFAGWAMKQEFSKEELETASFWYFIWSFLIRYIAPLMVIIVLLNALGVVAFVRSIMGV